MAMQHVLSWIVADYRGTEQEILVLYMVISGGISMHAIYLATTTIPAKAWISYRI